MHLVLDADGLGYGAGVFGLTPAALQAIRDRIMQPKDRAALLAAIAEGETTGCTFQEPELKRLPRGYEAQDDWEHLLRRKAYVMRTRQSQPAPGWLFADDCVDQIMALTNALMPLIRWLHP